MAAILIVEDDKVINSLVARHLKLVGHACEQAYDGLQAAALARANAYDLVLLDVLLPGQDGFALMPRLAPTPVIFITARDGLGDRIQGLNLGADDSSLLHPAG